MLIEENTIYMIDPAVDEFETDTYILDSIEPAGMYFKRYVNGGDEASDLTWFNNCEIEDVLIVAQDIL